MDQEGCGLFREGRGGGLGRLLFLLCDGFRNKRRRRLGGTCRFDASVLGLWREGGGVVGSMATFFCALADTGAGFATSGSFAFVSGTTGEVAWARSTITACSGRTACPKSYLPYFQIGNRKARCTSTEKAMQDVPIRFLWRGSIINCFLSLVLRRRRTWRRHPSEKPRLLRGGAGPA